ncbi:MAG: hypothetical protein KJO33_08260 [Gammaproteobacteria bacterium]|nr:hypothetical protein [Gammaproteobacteria bacterium]
MDEAEKILTAGNPGKNVPMTRLALVTGLDTRTLVKVRQAVSKEGPKYKPLLLAELTPESAIVEAWSTKIKNSKSVIKSRKLSYGSSNSAFDKLVRSTISTRGITTQSIIQRLVDTKSVKQHRDEKTLELLVDHYSPYLSGDEPNIINAAFLAISNLISTIEHNVRVEQAARFFQRQVWTFRLPSDQLEDFRMRKMLVEFEDQAKNEITPWEMENHTHRSTAAGVGMYYFEETDPLELSSTS